MCVFRFLGSVDVVIHQESLNTFEGIPGVCSELPFLNVTSVCFLQLDNPDEQAAQIRRELDGRLQMADQIARVGSTNPTWA